MTRLTNLNVRATVLKIFTKLKTCIFRKKKKTTKNKIKKKKTFLAVMTAMFLWRENIQDWMCMREIESTIIQEN